MKQTTLLTFCLMLVNLAFAQERAIKISSPDSEKVVLIPENKRIKVRTADGQKISGRFRMADVNTIAIDGQTIALSNIESVQRNPLLLTIFSSAFLIYGGALTAGMGAIIGVFVQTSGFLLLIPGAAMIFAGIKSPNILRNYPAIGNWQFEFIMHDRQAPL